MSAPAPLWIPAIDIEAAADAVEGARSRLASAEAQSTTWSSAAATQFRAELDGVTSRAAALAAALDEARVSWRHLQGVAGGTGQW